MPEVNITQPDEDAVLKEVWNTKDIEAKTELTSQQIESVNKLKTLAVIFDSELLGKHLQSFMTLQKSKDRKSMMEFVSVVKAKREDSDAQGRSFMSKIMG